MAKTQTALLASGVAETTIFVRLFTVLRVFTGLVWLSNGLAKVFEKRSYDIGFFSFNLVNKSTARGILTDAAHRTWIRPLGGFYEHAVLPHWGLWSVFLTLAELAPRGQVREPVAVLTRSYTRPSRAGSRCC